MAPPAPASGEALQQVIDRLWETVPPLWNHIRANVRGIASECFEMSVPQFRILRHIGSGVGSASALAALTQTSAPAVSQCVDALVEKGLITRRQSEQDRRCVDLALTPDGADVLGVIFAENRLWMEHKLASLNPEEMGHILRGLAALKDAFLT
ncbi:MAG TPA: MarR family transcriptional regulator [Anaerolineae bacterium]|nr:MarR family transcriptional regulator [Anaerolineae bacterium]HOR01391.1 MarR family transcriptional regulator [Anaerolineae bacterium]HPL27995.1 MarR family transcriptional regulator [Anaerolineae bacterium]